MTKETLKDRIGAEAFYNELFQLEHEKEELEVQLAKVKHRLSELHKNKILEDKKQE